MAHYGDIPEEELKNKVAADFFPAYDCTAIIGRVDFCVGLPADTMGLNEFESLLWAEAKKGTSHDIYESFIQLILTLGKERPQDKMLPPSFLGAFDAEKIAFLPYGVILNVLRQNDFNWNVAPSNHASNEFKLLKELLSDALHHGLEIYNYDTDAKDLAYFIKHNFYQNNTGTVRHIRINKNNFTHIYLKWLVTVKPTIAINWDEAKKVGIIDADFYLADILSKENNTLGEKLFVLLQNDHYLLDRQVNDFGLENFTKAQFSDGQKAHDQFWNRYARPPKREYWDYIVERRDLLVPQDVRERKGAFFTPQIWVEKSQQYLAAELGENWQDEYVVWDCCAGTGNLLTGLTNKYNIYASTLEKGDVQVIHQRIESMNAAARDKRHDGANLLPNHVFQFDFLNDSFFDEVDKAGNVIKKSKLPQQLQEILRDPEKRKKLVIYINPPYAEADNRKGEGRRGVAENRIHDKYAEKLKKAQREVFALFFIRIHDELNQCILAEFSKLKMLCASNFVEFRQVFNGAIKKSFIVPGNTFDNVKGAFPIGFFIWDLKEPQRFTEIITDAYDANGNFICKKIISSYDDSIFINKWIDQYRPNKKCIDSIGTMIGVASDFQNQKLTRIERPYMKVPASNHNWQINGTNLIESSIYLAVRHVIVADWLNDRDQFLYPNDGWKTDAEFQTDCLVYTLFHGQNRISARQGGEVSNFATRKSDVGNVASLENIASHWIPFTEAEVGAQEKFASHFMSDFLRGKIRVAGASATNTPTEGDLFAVNDDVVETCHGALVSQEKINKCT
ncbi:MAG: hypothetical protein K6E73_11625 [Bacteroidales bacterium]|nr:hypothetical protein [Bacteroidales bacterium]